LVDYRLFGRERSGLGAFDEFFVAQVHRVPYQDAAHIACGPDVPGQRPSVKF
jgi:hypothetical protein